MDEHDEETPAGYLTCTSIREEWTGALHKDQGAHIARMTDRLMDPLRLFNAPSMGEEEKKLLEGRDPVIYSPISLKEARSEYYGKSI